MGLFSSFIGLAGLGISAYSTVKQLDLAEDANVEIGKANDARKRIRDAEAVKRRRSETKQKIQQLREGRKVRAKAVSMGEQGGRNAFGSSFTGFQGSITSTTSANLGYLNQISKIDENIFNTGTQYSIFANKAQEFKNEIQTYKGITELAKTGVKALPVFDNFYETLKRGKYFG
tara:strand:+ start:45 stop:566 length:522 start_codon:yes stop_codon:yes gene_type:complete